MMKGMTESRKRSTEQITINRIRTCCPSLPAGEQAPGPFEKQTRQNFIDPVKPLRRGKKREC